MSLCMQIAFITTQNKNANLFVLVFCTSLLFLDWALHFYVLSLFSATFISFCLRQNWLKLLLSIVVEWLWIFIIGLVFNLSYWFLLSNAKYRYDFLDNAQNFLLQDFQNCKYCTSLVTRLPFIGYTLFSKTIPMASLTNYLSSFVNTSETVLIYLGRHISRLWSLSNYNISNFFGLRFSSR